MSMTMLHVKFMSAPTSVHNSCYLCPLFETTDTESMDNIAVSSFKLLEVVVMEQKTGDNYTFTLLHKMQKPGPPCKTESTWKLPS